MEVILQQDYPALGYVGDRVKVKGGFARNFLIPRGIALEASLRNERLLRHKLGGVTARRFRLRGEAQELAGKLEAVSLEFFLRMSGAGRAFGSITSRDIETALQKEGYIFDRRQIILPEPIKKAGEHKVSVKLHSEVSAQITVKVNTELPEAKPQGEEAPQSEVKKGRKARSPKRKAVEAAGQDESPMPPEERPEKQSDAKKRRIKKGKSEADAGSDAAQAEGTGSGEDQKG